MTVDNLLVISTFRISDSALSSMSDTGRFCPLRSERAGWLISTPETCKRASRSFYSMPAAESASVTRALAILRLLGASFRVLILITNFFACFSIRNFVVAKFGSSKYNEI